jgi:hypothetical protein
MESDPLRPGLGLRLLSTSTIEPGRSPSVTPYLATNLDQPPHSDTHVSGNLLDNQMIFFLHFSAGTQYGILCIVAAHCDDHSKPDGQ